MKSYVDSKGFYVSPLEHEDVILGNTILDIMGKIPHFGNFEIERFCVKWENPS